MCMLTFFPDGIQPNMEQLENGTVMNTDGHGFAGIVNGEIHVQKFMDDNEALEAFEGFRRKNPSGPAMFHSRMATDGVTSTYNVHPFWLGGSQKTVMGHNGIFPDSARPAKGDPRSDTRIVAESIVPARQSFTLYSRRGRRRFGKWMGLGNKVVVLTVDPRYRQNYYIINEDQGNWTAEGIWYSNYGYVKYSYPTYVIGGRGVDPWDDYDPPWWNQRDYEVKKDVAEYEDKIKWLHCDICSKKFSVNPFSLYCSNCYSCYECNSGADDCLCFIPGKSKLGKALAELPDSPTTIG